MPCLYQTHRHVLISLLFLNSSQIQENFPLDLKLGKSYSNSAEDERGNCSTFRETPVGILRSQSLHSLCRIPLPIAYVSSRVLVFKGGKCWCIWAQQAKRIRPASFSALQNPRDLAPRGTCEEQAGSAPKHRVLQKGWESNSLILTLGSFWVVLMLHSSSVGYSSFPPTHWH